ncbi:heterokaryon incompatibility protein-domain-containing protein [Dactylonectria macrodidyma]|uniref:Heterokaryon incompatibility protein-domain-containing protein n=1 Tax=Dactylonectria macrodidyma TaxID=307937 RepID=A0A9P9EXR2_9HYPO|nr:heterokaryon incompatibility protein-domain-containing protein [Dactylonectria macrodidyma]
MGGAGICVSKNNGKTVTLREGKNIEGGYAALSHCWGDGPRLTLNTGSVTKLTKGINIADLPKTFKDAVLVVKQLGISHLWIDSLCIFQDDSSDWARESARMAEVYGNSTITIAASRAANSSAGFLEERTSRNYVTVPFRAMANRGWVLQERYLSPRTIHFDSSQVCFECKTTFITEDNCSASPSSPNWQYRLPSSNYWETDWKQVVSLYSQCKLSMKTDKLPALAGIAKYFSNIAAAVSIDNRYLAGLWRNNIILDLCWQIDTRKHYQRRDGQYISTTWSWASLNSAIWFRPVKHPLAIFQNAHIDLDSQESPFGKITGGWILLRARKYRLKRKPGNNSKFSVSIFEEGPSFDVSVLWEDQKEADSPPIITDLRDNGPHEAPFVAIPLAYYEFGIDFDSDEVEIFFIVTKAAEHDLPSSVGVKPFERVGSTNLDLRKTDKRRFERLGLYRGMKGNDECMKDELEDVMLI